VALLGRTISPHIKLTCSFKEKQHNIKGDLVDEKYAEMRGKFDSTVIHLFQEKALCGTARQGWFWPPS
jgi:hypothetical protein